MTDELRKAAQDALLEECRNRFDYVDGQLIRRATAASNALKGSSVGAINSRGYLCTRIFGASQRIHRLIFLMHYGYLPETIDHIDGDKLNNRIENLRSATFVQNQQNRPKHPRNSSGYKGVSWDKDRKKWVAQIRASNRSHNLGRFVTAEEAYNAACLAREMLHGEFANHG